MRILFLPVHLGLAPFVHSLWSFEGPGGLPQSDRRMVVPNGRSKFILTVQGELWMDDGEITVFPQGRALFVGPWDRPVVLSSPPGPTRTVGMELTPAGSHRFFDQPLIEVQNRVVDLTDLWPSEGRNLAEVLSGDLGPWAAAEALQSVLLTRWQEKPRASPVVDFVVGELSRRSGLVEIRELERRTGYTRRTIDGLFRRHVGLSPKTLATIVRFQKVYRRWAQGDGREFRIDLDPGLYFDQSHLIREFKRFTGYSPGRFAGQPNQFGRIFYSRPT